MKTGVTASRGIPLPVEIKRFAATVYSLLLRPVMWLMFVIASVLTLLLFMREELRS